MNDDEIKKTEEEIETVVDEPSKKEETLDVAPKEEQTVIKTTQEKDLEVKDIENNNSDKMEVVENKAEEQKEEVKTETINEQGKEISQRTVSEDTIKQDLAWKKREDGSFVREGVVEIIKIEDLNLQILDLKERIQNNERNLIPLPVGVIEQVTMAVDKWNGDYIATDIEPFKNELRIKEELLAELSKI